MMMFNVSHLRLITCPFYPETRIQQMIAYGSLSRDSVRPVLRSGGEIIRLHVKFPETDEKSPWPHESVFDLREFLLKLIDANLEDYYKVLMRNPARAQNVLYEAERIKRQILSELSTPARRHEATVNIAPSSVERADDKEGVDVTELEDDSVPFGLALTQTEGREALLGRSCTVAVAGCFDNYPGVLHLLLGVLAEQAGAEPPFVLNIEYFRTLTSYQRYVQDVEILGRYLPGGDPPGPERINGLTFYGIGASCTAGVDHWLDRVQQELDMDPVRISMNRFRNDGAVRCLRVLKKRYLEPNVQDDAYPTVPNCPISRFEDRETGQFGCPRIPRMHGSAEEGWPVKIKAKITDSPGSLRRLLEIIGLARPA